MSGSGKGSRKREPNPFSKAQLAQASAYRVIQLKTDAERLTLDNEALRMRVVTLEAREERLMAEIKRMAEKYIPPIKNQAP